MAKMNSLIDVEIIKALYEASQAGVRSRSERSRHVHAQARHPRPQ
jgi:hypothetical protein